jgi:hypothetical protein
VSGSPESGAARPAPTWALVLLPVFAILLVYVWVPRSRYEAELAALRADLAGARATAVTTEVESAEAHRVAALSERAAELRARSSGATPSSRADTGPAAHARRAARVTDALARHGLVLLEDVAVPEAGEDAARRLPGLHATEIRAAGAPARAVRFEGGYFDALEALREIAGARVEALPLSVELARSADGRTLRWRLVWI